MAGIFYAKWRWIQQVLYNPNNREYWISGGGTGLDCHWERRGGYPKFEKYILTKLGLPPTSQHKLTRRNQKRGWHPGNLQWELQGDLSNRMINQCRLIKYRGRTQNVRQWSRELGIPYYTIIARLDRGLSVEEALTAQRLKRKKNVKA